MLDRRNEKVEDAIGRLCVFRAFAVHKSRKGRHTELREPSEMMSHMKAQEIANWKNVTPYAQVVDKEIARKSKKNIIGIRVFVTKTDKGYYLFGTDSFVKKDEKSWFQYTDYDKKGKKGSKTRYSNGSDFLPDMVYGYVTYDTGDVEYIYKADFVEEMYLEV